MSGAVAGGDTIIDGKYRVVRTLGSGGMGDVFVVEHVFLRKMLALKLLRRELTDHPEAIARFEQEARATSLLEHPNIVRVSDFGRTPTGELYLVMELLTGQALADVMAKTPQLSPERACDIVCQVLAGLEAAHMHRIIHRDLKPENVFLLRAASGKGTPSGLAASSPFGPSGAATREHVKILDFGIAKLQGEQDLRLTSMGNIVGTPQYMAPEQARGEAELDHRIDIHAVGVILYELLSGRPPYDGENYHQVIARILTAAPPNLLSLVPALDPSLASIVHMALAKQPSERFPSAVDFREAIEQVVSGWYPQSARELTASVVDVPLRVDLLAGAVEAPGGASSARMTDPGVSPAHSSTETGGHDPFAPPGEKSEVALELASTTAPPSAMPPPAPAAPFASVAADEVPVHVFLAQKRREAQGPGRLVRAIVLGTLGFSLIMGLIYLGRSFQSDDSTLSLRPASKATVRIDNLPEDSVVMLDGVRTFLNPIEMSLSSATHEIRIEAEGFRPRTFLFVPDKDITFDAAMERVTRGSTKREAKRDIGRDTARGGSKAASGKSSHPTLAAP